MAPDVGTRAHQRMVGRDDLRERLRQHLAELAASASAGPGRLVWVEGEAGIGKTRLLAEAELLAAEAGVHVLRAAAWSDPATPAFWLWTQVLRHALARSGTPATPDAVTARWGQRGGAVTRILPESGATSTAPSQRGADRFPLFDAVAATLAAEAASGPVVVVLDDLHWADPDSLQLLVFLVSTGLPPGVLVLGAWREHETTPDDAVDDARARLARHGEVLRLTGLSPPDVGALVAATSGIRLDAGQAQELTARTAGNPLFAAEVGRLAAARGDGAVGRLVPDSARALLRRRLARLPHPCVTMLAAAAVVGAAPSLRLVAAATGEPLDEVADRLAEAARAGLAEVDDGSLAFSHALVREALVETVPGPQRRALHAATADALAARVDLDPARLAEAAHHAVAALPAGDLDRAVEWGTRAAAAAFESQAYADASRGFRRVAEVLDVADRRRGGVLRGWGEALAASGEPEAARAAFEEAAALARRAGDAHALAAAALGFAAGLAGFEVRLFDTTQIGLISEALDALPTTDSVVRADLLARLSVALSYTDDDDARPALAEEALAMARRVGDAPRRGARPGRPLRRPRRPGAHRPPGRRGR